MCQLAGGGEGGRANSTNSNDRNRVGSSLCIFFLDSFSCPIYVSFAPEIYTVEITHHFLLLLRKEYFDSPQRDSHVVHYI
jgi:hypothetical protein